MIAGIVLLVTAASVGIYMLMKSSDKQSIKTTPVAKETQVDGRPFDQIDAQLAQYRIDAEKDRHYSSGISGWSNYSSLAYSHNDTNNFALTAPKQKNVYKLQDLSKSELQGDDYCASINKKWSSKVTDAKTVFEEGGYKVAEVRLYSQFNDCNKELIASKYLSLFSILRAYIRLRGADTLDIGVSCSPLSELADEIAQSKEVHQIHIDTGIDQPAGSQLVTTVTYIKDSNTTGYRIASLMSPLNLYYYKQSDGKWVMVEKEGDLKCTTKDPEIRAAFKGQECSTDLGKTQIL